MEKSKRLHLTAGKNMVFSTLIVDRKFETLKKTQNSDYLFNQVTKIDQTGTIK